MLNSLFSGLRNFIFKSGILIKRLFELIQNILINQFLNHAIQNLDKKSVTISVIYNFLTLLIIICGFAKLLLVIKNHICSEMACACVHLWICLTWRKEKIAIFVRSKKCNSKFRIFFFLWTTWDMKQVKPQKRVTYKLIKSKSWMDYWSDKNILISTV